MKGRQGVEGAKEVMRAAGVGRITKPMREALNMTLNTRQQKALVKQYGERKVWLVLYCHHPRVIGFKGGLTYAEAEAEAEVVRLKTETQFLRYYKVLISHDEGEG